MSPASVSSPPTREAGFEGDSHKQPQTCVQFVDVDANIPATLKRDEPLPFGSKELRPPRGKR
jgi:hypothetical protein